MLFRKRPSRIYFYGPSVDFRKQLNGLCLIIEGEFGTDCLMDSWFVFVSKDKKKAKIVYWRQTGFALWQFRLEKDLFELGSPRISSKGVISWKNLGLFLDGYNIFHGEPHARKKVKRYS